MIAITKLPRLFCFLHGTKIRKDTVCSWNIISNPANVPMIDNSCAAQRWFGRGASQCIEFRNMVRDHIHFIHPVP
jgi:hypothetical protein